MTSPNNELSINTLRFLAVDAVEKAASGHPGMPMGAAAMAYTLWTRFLKFDPRAPKWPDRDRFVLSAGHGSMLLYGLLHLSGYDLPLDEIKNFRQLGSATPGHPEFGHTHGVETTTGPLGQGIAAAVGMAMAERHLAGVFNRPGFELVDHHTYCLCGDGCLMEGVSSEAASLAGHLGLGKLILLYDDNRITIEGSTDLAFTEDPSSRFEAYGWHSITVENGNDVEALISALAEAKRENTKPSLIRVKTHIAFGSPNKQDDSCSHGSPLGTEEVKATKVNLGWPLEPLFLIPDEARVPFTTKAHEGQAARAAWEETLKKFRSAHPQLASEWDRLVAGQLPKGWENALPSYPADPKGIATRVASGKAINALAPVVPELFGGSADLAPSNNTHITGGMDFEKDGYMGRNIRFGVREFAMGAVSNGISNHGLLRPFNATFFVFTDYMRPAIRLAALMGSPVIYVMTHDSFHVGEDGPTHQPVEHLASLRAMPNISIIRPADANETSVAWRLAMESKHTPTMLVLTRQNLPVLDRAVFPSAELTARGAYVLKKEAGDIAKGVILIGSGSEVHLALDAAAELEKKSVPARVVNMASWDLFQAQPSAYKEEVLPSSVHARVTVEAASTFGWERYAGAKGKMIGLDHFGASAPGSKLAKQFNFTVENIVEKALSVI